MNGIHYLYRAIGILVFQPVVDKLHVGWVGVGCVNQVQDKMDKSCTVGLARETKTDQGVEREGGITDPRCTIIPVSILSCRAAARIHLRG